jgi:hypothetical protein
MRHVHTYDLPWLQGWWCEIAVGLLILLVQNANIGELTLARPVSDVWAIAAAWTCNLASGHLASTGAPNGRQASMVFFAGGDRVIGSAGTKKWQQPHRWAR